MIELRDLQFVYAESGFELQVERLFIAKGQRVGWIGPSGSGKTTLLHLVAGIFSPAAGRVDTCGQELTALRDAARRDFRIAHVGLVFQDFALLDYLSVLDNILLPYRIHRLLRLESIVRDRAQQLASEVGLGDMLTRRPTQLSQGEHQRVAVCRALIANPQLILADEPTAHLDPGNAARVLDILDGYATRQAATLVVVTHDRNVLTRFDETIDVSTFCARLSQCQQRAAIMRDSFYLAWQYLRHHRLTTAVLVTSITLIIYLPAALQTIVANATEHFRSRADSTPLVVGPRGSALELVLGSVYFDKPYEDVLRLQQLGRIEEQELGQAIPLHARFEARDCQIVGTTEEYLRLRNLRTARGKMWSMVGECVIGARVADRLSVQVGDKIPVSTSTAFTLNNPPLRLHVVGVLATTETPDDEVIFVALDTAWIIEGLGHGHVRGAQHGSSEAKLYTDITKENVASFHFHGDRANFPITAIIVTPINEKAQTMLLGQYFSPDETAHIVRPRQVMDALLERVVMVRSFMIAIIAVVSLVTLLTIALVIALSIRLRRAEIVTMSKMGCSRFTIASVLGSQIAIIVCASSTFATTLALLTDAYGSDLVRLLIL